MNNSFAISMSLYFCPRCRSISAHEDRCSSCGLQRRPGAKNYVEKLLETVLSPESSRAGMAIDVLTKWLHEPRALIPLLQLAESDADTYRLVLAARGLGWLGDREAVPVLVKLLQEQQRPFVLRIAVAQSLGMLGGNLAKDALEKALEDARPSVASAAAEALKQLSVPSGRGG